ncbi:AraC family transcriptional regulator [Mycobacterium frederiksbergense]|uniref:AraC family transcriptional regulator n=1 Tax=Mycolicibacterium frederiksbergense TaxID=117567 RepID=A0ABT6KW08_9MYCO|nr:AraC family transcriptional regulator [Mycolicibacterium frederiksbergense]MDH6194854.1 AraC family transcriptional regulator [Mycolicibacterium frederiksbergense]
MSKQPQSNEQALSRRQVGAESALGNITVLGIDVSFVTQPFTESIEWSFTEPDHKVLVWRGGSVHSKEVEFERGPAGRITPRAGNVWVIPAEQRSAALARHVTCEFVALTLPTLMLGDDTLRPVVGRRDPLLLHLVERMVDVAGRDDVVSRLLRESLADTLRLHIGDRYGERSQPQRRTGRELSRDEQQCLIEFLHDSLDAEVNLSTLADLVGMSVHGFSHAFAQTFGTTPYQFVLDQRIAQSKRLLATTPLSVTEISHTVGFSSPSHFATAFKQRVGLTPSAFRRDADR